MQIKVVDRETRSLMKAEHMALLPVVEVMKQRYSMYSAAVMEFRRIALQYRA